MQKILPPLCFVLALLAMVGGFATLAVEEPEPGMELHRARVSGDEKHARKLEAELEGRRWWRRALIGSLFTSSVLLTAAGFLSMNPPRRPSRERLPDQGNAPG